MSFINNKMPALIKPIKGHSTLTSIGKLTEISPLRNKFDATW
jgi:hypothetical protein